MYTFHVDFVLHFVPPMSDHGPGIRLNRTFELPFPPSASISVFSKDWEGMDDPMGYHLKEIAWDLDRSKFVVGTELSSTRVPIAIDPS